MIKYVASAIVCLCLPEVDTNYAPGYWEIILLWVFVAVAVEKMLFPFSLSVSSQSQSHFHLWLAFHWFPSIHLSLSLLWQRLYNNLKMQNWAVRAEWWWWLCWWTVELFDRIDVWLKTDWGADTKVHSLASFGCFLVQPSLSLSKQLGKLEMLHWLTNEWMSEWVNGAFGQRPTKSQFMYVLRLVYAQPVQR